MLKVIVLRFPFQITWGGLVTTCAGGSHSESYWKTHTWPALSRNG